MKFGWLATAFLVANAMISPARADDVVLRIATQGGEDQKTLVKYTVSRFTAATGVKVEFVNGNPPDHLQKMIAARGRVAPFDIVYLDDKVQAQAISAGLVMKLDPAIVTNLGDLYDEAKQKDGYGPAVLLWSWGLVYNVKAFKDNGIPEPTSWEDLWSPKLAGKVSIADISGPGGVDFVLKAAQLAGGSEKDLMPGLKKISQLKVQSYYASSNDVRSKFLSGDVWAAPWNNGRPWAMIDEGAPLRFFYPKEGGFLHTTTVDVVKGTTHPKEAQMWINFVLDPLSQLGHSYEIPYTPVNKTLDAVLRAHPEISKKFPVPGTDEIKLLTKPDWNVVFDDYPALVDNWNRTVKVN